MYTVMVPGSTFANLIAQTKIAKKEFYLSSRAEQSVALSKWDKLFTILRIVAETAQENEEVDKLIPPKKPIICFQETEAFFVDITVQE